MWHDIVNLHSNHFGVMVVDLVLFRSRTQWRYGARDRTKCERGEEKERERAKNEILIRSRYTINLHIKVKRFDVHRVASSPPSPPPRWATRSFHMYVPYHCALWHLQGNTTFIGHKSSTGGGTMVEAARYRYIEAIGWIIIVAYVANNLAMRSILT